jgi:hypothetical protein
MNNFSASLFRGSVGYRIAWEHIFGILQPYVYIESRGAQSFCFFLFPAYGLKDISVNTFMGHRVANFTVSIFCETGGSK